MAHVSEATVTNTVVDTTKTPAELAKSATETISITVKIPKATFEYVVSQKIGRKMESLPATGNRRSEYLQRNLQDWLGKWFASAEKSLRNQAILQALKMENEDKFIK